MHPCSGTQGEVLLSYAVLCDDVLCFVCEQVVLVYVVFCYAMAAMVGHMLLCYAVSFTTMPCCNVTLSCACMYMHLCTVDS